MDTRRHECSNWRIFDANGSAWRYALYCCRSMKYLLRITGVKRGERWGPAPKEMPLNSSLQTTKQASNSRVSFTMYLALRDEGIFRSTDGGAHTGSPLNDGLTVSEKISAMTAIGKTVFTGTENGLYRLDSDVWKKLPLDTPGAVCSLAVSGTELYAGIGHEMLVRFGTRTGWDGIQHGDLHFTQIFHSTDLGASWTEIKLGGEHLRKRSPAGITVLVRGKVLLALSSAQSRSTDGGQTWTALEKDYNFSRKSRLPVVMVDEMNLLQSECMGHSPHDGWWNIMAYTLWMAMIGTTIVDLVAFNNTLYAHTGYDVYQSTDGGVSWKKLWNHEREAVLNIPTTRSDFCFKTDTCWRHSLFSFRSRKRRRQCGYFPFIDG